MTANTGRSSALVVYSPPEVDNSPRTLDSYSGGNPDDGVAKSSVYAKYADSVFFDEETVVAPSWLRLRDLL